MIGQCCGLLMQRLVLQRAAASACARVQARVIASPRRRNETTLPVVTSVGEILGFCHADISGRIAEERLKYDPDKLELFKSPELRVSTYADKFAVEIPFLKEMIKVSVLEFLHTNLSPLTPCFSVTHKGQLRFTEAFVRRPESQSSVEAILSTLMYHESLAYLDGLDLKLAGRVNGQWKLLTNAMPADVEELGLVTPNDSVRVVDVHCGDHYIPVILRRYPGETVLDSLKDCCDWRAWPAVSAYSGELVESNSALIIPGGVGACASCVTRASDCWCREREEAHDTVSESAHPRWSVCCGAARSESETRSRGLASQSLGSGTRSADLGQRNQYVCGLGWRCLRSCS
jgi:hypothetical protein